MIVEIIFLRHVLVPFYRTITASFVIFESRSLGSKQLRLILLLVNQLFQPIFKRVLFILQFSCIWIWGGEEVPQLILIQM